MGQRHAVELTKKNGATLRIFKLTRAIVNRAREGASYMAEELVLDHLTGDGATIDCHKMTGFTSAVLV